jgi:hypothetical protein
MAKLSKNQITSLVALFGLGTAATMAIPEATPALMAAATKTTGVEIAQIIFASSLGIA